MKAELKEQIKTVLNLLDRQKITIWEANDEIERLVDREYGEAK